MKTFIILTPVYNDWENLNKLLEKINDEAERNNFEFEIFVVNDSSTINADINFPNYGITKSKNNYEEKNLPFKVDYVDGFSILLNKKKISASFLLILYTFFIHLFI